MLKKFLNYNYYNIALHILVLSSIFAVLRYYFNNVLIWDISFIVSCGLVVFFRHYYFEYKNFITNNGNRVMRSQNINNWRNKWNIFIKSPAIIAFITTFATLYKEGSDFDHILRNSIGAGLLAFVATLSPKDNLTENEI